MVRGCALSVSQAASQLPVLPAHPAALLYYLPLVSKNQTYSLLENDILIWEQNQ